MIRSRMRFCLALLVLVLGATSVVHADATFSFYASNAGQPTFNRPSDVGSLSGQITRYSVVRFFPNAASTCSIYSTQEGDSFDGVILLYQGSFNPASPLTNLIAVNDDFSTSDGGLGIGTSAIEREALTFVDDWIVVLAGFIADDVGTATVTVSCSNPATRVIAGNGSSPAYDGRYTELLNGRFRVSATWTNFSSVSGDGTFVPLGANDSGLIWFFNAQNFEVLIKAVNGCSLNGHFWIFYAATTNVQFTITVTDTVTGVTRFYTNPLGTNAFTAVTDVEAFATCI